MNEDDMCLAVPGKIISIDRSIPGMTMAKVDFGGILKNICIEWVDVEEGNYILAHAGIAISAVDEKEAEETIYLVESGQLTVDS